MMTELKMSKETFNGKGGHGRLKRTIDRRTGEDDRQKDATDDRTHRPKDTARKVVPKDYRPFADPRIWLLDTRVFSWLIQQQPEITVIGGDTPRMNCWNGWRIVAAISGRGRGPMTTATTKRDRRTKAAMEHLRQVMVDFCMEHNPLSVRNLYYLMTQNGYIPKDTKETKA